MDLKAMCLILKKHMIILLSQGLVPIIRIRHKPKISYKRNMIILLCHYQLEMSIPVPHNITIMNSPVS